MTAHPVRTSAATTQAVGFVAVVGVALLARTTLNLGPSYPVKAAALFSVVALFAIRAVTRHHPFPRFGPANQVTTLRVLLVALVAGLIGEPVPVVAAGAAAAGLIVALLDGLDGWLARRTRMASAFGARFDMEIDALLILVLAILAWQDDKAGAWVVMSGLLRYIFVAAGWLFAWMRRPLPSGNRGKVICVVQIVALIVAIAPVVTPPASTAIAACGLLALGYSFLVDTVWLWRQGTAII